MICKKQILLFIMLKAIMHVQRPCSHFIYIDFSRLKCLPIIICIVHVCVKTFHLVCQLLERLDKNKHY